MGRKKTGVESVIAVKIPRVKRLTKRRQEGITTFLKKTLENPEKYGGYVSASWIQMLIYFLREPKQNKSSSSDIKTWLKADCFQLLVNQIRNGRRIGNLFSPLNLVTRPNRQVELTTGPPATQTATATEGFYPRSKADWINCIRVKEETENESLDNHDEEPLGVDIFLGNQESETENRVETELQMMTETNQVEEQVETAIDPTFWMPRLNPFQGNPFEHNNDDHQEPPHLSPDPLQFEHPCMEVTSSSSLPFDAPVAHDGDESPVMILAHAEEEEEGDWESSIRIRVHSPGEFEVDQSPSIESEAHSLAEGVEAVHDNGEWAQQQCVDVPADGSGVKEAMVLCTNEMMLAIEHLRMNQGYFRAAGDAEVKKWYAVYQALKLVKELILEA